MKGKEYKKPTMKVIELRQSSQLLGGSWPDYIPEEW